MRKKIIQDSKTNLSLDFKGTMKSTMPGSIYFPTEDQWGKYAMEKTHEEYVPVCKCSPYTLTGGELSIMLPTPHVPVFRAVGPAIHCIFVCPYCGGHKSPRAANEFNKLAELELDIDMDEINALIDGLQ